MMNREDLLMDNGIAVAEGVVPPGTSTSVDKMGGFGIIVLLLA
jgi:hypothetical protein